MQRLTQNLKRIGTDAAGYILILLGIAFGWLPGPGGIPLILIGLALLSINNKWAATLRDYIVKRSGKFLEIAFPDRPIVQWLYDILTILLFAVSFLFSLRHNAIWQVSLAIFLFFMGLLIATYNRDRFGLKRRKQKKHKQ